MSTHIAICDDEAPELAYLQRLVGDWSKKEKRSILVSVFDSAEAFLFSYEEDKSFDILLLDVQMKNMDGINLAKKLRETDQRLQIIFITGYPDFIGEGYEVSALHYLLKPVNELKLYEVLDRALIKLFASMRTVLLPISGGSIRLPADDILYGEVFSHYIELYTLAQTFQIRISMNELELLLGDGFFRCHRSYIAGMRHVRRVTRTSMLLDNNVELPLSRKLYDDANQKFIKFN